MFNFSQNPLYIYLYINALNDDNKYDRTSLFLHTFVRVFNFAKGIAQAYPKHRMYTFEFNGLFYRIFSYLKHIKSIKHIRMSLNVHSCSLIGNCE